LKAVAAERRPADVPAELDVAPVGTISEQEWRGCWPSVDGAELELEPADNDARAPEAPEAPEVPEVPEVPEARSEAGESAESTTESG
jgi:XTP/dITP diphosphohydrolase